MSPTILPIGGYRFYFFSRDEPRAYVHLQHATWLEPVVELPHDYGLGHRQISVALRLLKENEDEIRVASRRFRLIHAHRTRGQAHAAA